MSADHSPADDEGSVLFDAHGLLAGEAGDALWSHMCLRLEADLSEAGWDQPTRLFAVANPVDTEAAAGFDVGRAIATEHGVDDVDPDALATAFAVTLMAEFGGHPVHELWGFSAPSWAAAVVMAFEGWQVSFPVDEDGNQVPDEHADLPPSQHPLRVENRSVMMLTRGGSCYLVERIRGEEPRQVLVEVRDGVVMDVLHRTLGLPTTPPPTTVADILGRIVLRGALAALSSLTDEPSETDDEESGEPASDRSAAAAAAASKAREELGRLDEVERREVLQRVAASSLLTSLIHVVWMATEHGKRGVSEQSRQVLARVVERGVEGLDDFEAVLLAARAASDLTFPDLAAGEHSSSILPEDVAEADPGWADEGTLCRRLMWQSLPDQGVLVDEIEHRVGPLPRPFLGTLAGCGWLYVEEPADS